MYRFCLLSKYSLLSPLPSFHSETKDGQVQAVKNNPAVPTKVLAEIFEWKQSGVDDNDIMTYLLVILLVHGQVSAFLFVYRKLLTDKYVQHIYFTTLRR